MAPVDLNDKTKNWLKAVLALKHLKNGLLSFVDTEVSEFHKNFIVTHGTCNRCTTNNANHCPNGVCNQIRAAIVGEHFKGKPMWSNTDATKWSSDAWEVAKCFLPPRSQDDASSAGTDCSKILSLCLHCKHITALIDHHDVKDKFKKNRDNRNALMHSGSQEVSNAVRSSSIQDAVQLLSTFQAPVDRKTQDCIDTLNEIDSDGWLLTKDDIVGVMKDKVEAVRLKQEELEASLKKTDETVAEHTNTLETVGKKGEELEASLKKTDETVAEHTNTLETYKKQIRKLEDQLREVDSIIKNYKEEDEVKKMYTEMETIRKKNEEMVTRVDALETKLKEHETKLKEHDERLEEHGGQLEKHGGQLEEHCGRLEEHGGRLEEHGGQLEKHGGQLEEHCGQLEEHGGQLEEHGGQLKEQGGQLEELKGAVKEIGRVQELLGRIGRTRVGGQLEEHGGQLEEHGGQLEKHGGQLEEHCGQLEEHGGQLEEHGGQLKEQGGQLEELKGAVKEIGRVQELLGRIGEGAATKRPGSPTELHKEVLRQSRIHLMEGIERPNDVVDRLYQHDDLSFTHARDLMELPNTFEKIRKLIDVIRLRGPKGYESLKQSLRDTGHEPMEHILTHTEYFLQADDEPMPSTRPSLSKLGYRSSDNQSAYDEIFIRRKVAEAQVRLEAHIKVTQALGVSAKTQLSKMVVDTVQERNMVILTGKPGAGKSFQGVNAMQLLIEDNTELPLIMSDPNEIEKALDPSKRYVLFIDDLFGGRAANETELRKWVNYGDVLEQLAYLHKIKVIIAIRKDVLVKHKLEFKFLNQHDSIDLDVALSREEKVQILKLYQQRQCITVDGTEASCIVGDIPEDTGIGFPLICKLMHDNSFPKAKSVETMKELFLQALDNGSASFFVLAMTLLCNDRLDIYSLSEDENNCFLAVKEYCNFEKVTKATFMQEAYALRGTYIQGDGCFSFVHDTVIDATFLASVQILPGILFKLCHIEMLTKGINNYLQNTTIHVHLNQSQLKAVVNRFASVICNNRSSKDLACLFASVVWDNPDFINLTMNQVAENCFFGTDENGRTLINYLIKFGKHEIVERLIKQKNITDEMVIQATKGGSLPMLKLLYEQTGKSLIQDNDNGDTLLHMACRKGYMAIIEYLVECNRAILTLPNNAGQYAGHIAARNGYQHVLQYLLSQDINTTTAKRRTLLHMAALGGRVDTVTYLLENFKTLIEVTDNDGLSAAHYAAAGGDVECLKYLLASGLSPTLPTRDGSTMLHIAAQYRHIDMVKYICDKHAELLEVTDKRGLSATHCAAQGGDIECLKYLLRAGLSPTLTTRDGLTILHTAALYRNIDMVKYICDKHAELLEVTDKGGLSATHCAAQGGDIECLKYLLRAGLSPTLTTRGGLTILHTAAQSRHIDMVTYICDKHAELLEVTDERGGSATHCAAAGGDVECLTYLLTSGLSPTLTTRGGYTMLHIAAQCRHIDMVKYICDKHAELLEVTDKRGLSATHCAAQGGDIECLKYLLTSGLSPTLTTRGGLTMLHIAAQCREIDMVTYLCDSYTELLEVTDEGGRSAAHYAAAVGDVECLTYLLASGLSPTLTTRDGRTMLHTAALYRHIDMVKYIFDKHAELLEVTDKRGLSATHCAAQGGDIECLKYLLRAGLSPTLTTRGGYTMLHIAARCRHIDMVKYICDKHAELLEVTDEGGWSAAHYAAAGGDVECLKYLLRAGLSPTLTTRDGHTMLHIAADNRNIGMVKYICHTYAQLIEMTDNTGRSAGHFDAHGGDIECLKYLLASGLSPTLTTRGGYTMLHVAAYNRNIDIVKYICDTYTQLIEMTDNTGKSAGHSAARGGDIECLKYILASGLPLMCKDKHGRTLLHEASASKNIDIVKYLCDNHPELSKI